MTEPRPARKYLGIVLAVFVLAISSVTTVGLGNTAAFAAQQTWSKTYGGWAGDYPHYMRQTLDGGYIIAGETDSFGSSSGDMWIVKTDSSGGIAWQKTYAGGTHADYAATIELTSDGGYIVAGGTGSFGWLIKLSSGGSVVWEKALSQASSLDHAFQASDGGYVAVGTHTQMINGLQHTGMIALKTDSDGELEWLKRFEHVRFNHVVAVRQTVDGGYIIGANMEGDLIGGTRDIWLIKLGSDGAIQWEKAYGKTVQNGNENLVAMDLTNDGGYVLAASRPNLVLKLDSTGKVEWEKSISGDLDLQAIRSAIDGGYILAGTVLSPGYDVFLIKLGSSGSVVWDSAYGGSGTDIEPSVDGTSDGGFVVAARTDSFGVRNTDVWVLKVDSSGQLNSCSKGLVKDLAASASKGDSPVRESSASVEEPSIALNDSHATVAKTSATVGVLCEAVAPTPSDPCANPTIRGTDGPDVIKGTNGNDVIDARGGDDKVSGLEGNDVICGGSGNDTLVGNSGSDKIFGGIGSDSISGGTGNDELNGGSGNDSISGNGGSDKLIGSSGNDTLSGIDGIVNNDSLDGGTGTDTCNSNPDPEANCEV